MNSEINIDEIKTILHELRRQLIARIGLREEGQVEQIADDLDRAQALEARELAMQYIDRSVRQLRHIEEALRRIDTGDYGACLECEEDIGLKRIHAVPWAQRCIKCQDRLDQDEQRSELSKSLQKRAA